MTQVKLVSLFLKHDDRAVITIIDENGNEIIEKDGYMPYAGILGGDETEFKIDNETGKIIGWVPLAVERDPDDEDSEIKIIAKTT